MNSRNPAIIFLVVLILLASGLVLSQSDGSEVRVHPDIASEFESTQSQGFTASNQESDKVEMIVSLEDYGNPSNIEEMKQKASKSQTPLEKLAENNRDKVEMKNSFWIINAVHLEVDSSFPLEKITDIERVERINTNFGFQTHQSIQKDVQTQNTDTTYGLEQISAFQAWNEFGTKGENISVSVLDTGVFEGHDDIEIDDEDWKDFIYNNQSAVDHQYHGTHVSGTVVGGNSSDRGWIGVAPGADLMHGAVLDEDGSGSLDGVLDGMQWSVENNADIISMSLGTPCDEEGAHYVEDYIDAIENAEENNVIVVSSSGNEYEGCTSSPGNVYDAFSVGSSNIDGEIASSSSGDLIDTSEAWGIYAPDEWPDEYIVPKIAAPGVDVYSAYVSSSSSYIELSGTSMAAPHVSGGAAVMQSATDVNLKTGQIKEAFEETASKPEEWDEETDAEYSKDGRDSRYGDGIIDVYEATKYSLDNFQGYNLSNLQINQTEVNLTENVKVTGDVENLEDQEQDVTLELKLDEDVKDTKTLTLGSNTEESFEFIHETEETGTYNISVDQEKVDELEVIMPPPEFSIEDLGLNETEIIEGEKINASGLLVNDGGEAQTTLDFKLNDTVNQTRNLTVDMESSKAFSFVEDFYKPGEYQVSVNNSHAGDLDVLKDAELVINNLMLNSTEIFEGGSVKASVYSENIGEVDGTFQINISEDGTIIDSESRHFPAESSDETNFTLEYQDSGTYTISSRNQEEQLEVLEPGEIRIISSSLVADEIVEGEKANVSVETENIGDESVSGELVLKNEEENILDQKEISLDPESEKQFLLNTTMNETGSQNLYLNGTEHVIDVLKEAELNQTDFYLENPIVENETSKARTTVENIGEVKGNFTVDYTLDGSEEYTEQAELDSGNQTNISHSRRFDSPGDYQIEMLEKNEVLTVLQEATFNIIDASTNSTEIFTGQEVKIEASIENEGEVEGNETFEFSAANASQIKQTTLENQSQTNITQELQIDEEGNFDVTVNETVAGNLEVKEPTVNILNTSHNISDKGLVNIEAELNNTDPAYTDHLLNITSNQSEITSREVNLKPNERKNTTITGKWNKTGNYSLNLNEQKLANFSLNPSAEFTNVEPDSETFDEGDTVKLSSDIDAVGEGNYTVLVDNQEPDNGTLNPGHNTFSLSNTFEPGEYEWSIESEIENSTFKSDTYSFEIEEEEDDSEDSSETDSGPDPEPDLAPAPEPEPELQVEETENTVEITNIYETHSIELNQTGLPIRKIEFENFEDNKTLTFESSESEEEASFYSVFSANTDLNGPFQIELEVTKDWIEDNHFEPEEISVYRINGMEDQEASIIEENPEEVLYSVEIESFSDFGIGVDRACYSMEEVSAASENSCELYNNPCKVPDEKEIVDSCTEFTETQDVADNIQRIRQETEDEEAREKLEQAEQALEAGDAQQAQEIVEEVESEQTGSVSPYPIIASSLLITLLIVGGLKIYRHEKKKKITRKITQLTDLMKKLDRQGEEVADAAQKLRDANIAAEKGEYQEASRITGEIREDLDNVAT